MTGARVEVRGVTKQYAGADGQPGPVVLRDVDATIEPGESVAIVGPSGSGKSTLLNLIGGLDKATEGSICIDGTNLATLDERNLAAVRNQSIGFIFQAHHLLPQCSALENVLIPTLVVPDPKHRKDAVGRGEALLGRVGLGERLHHKPSQLSGGERQRVAVVRALINQPHLLLADEPTGSLDSVGADALGVLLRELNREEGVTLVTVTHSEKLADTMERGLELRDAGLVEREATS